MRGLPCTPETGIWGCRSLTFLPLSFWGTRLPFWFSLSVALNSVTDITVVSQDIAYVCVCVCYVWILRKAALYFIFKLWLLLHSPTYNGSTPEGWIVFCYQFSKKNKAMQANTTKRTGAKFSPKDFLSLTEKQEITERLSHQCRSNFLLLYSYKLQNIVQVPVTAVLSEISPVFYFWKFAGVLPIFPSWGPDLYVDQYLLKPFIMKWRVKISFSLPENRTYNGSSRSQKLKEAEPDLLIIGLVLQFTLPEEPALQMCSKAEKLTCIIYL